MRETKDGPSGPTPGQQIRIRTLRFLTGDELTIVAAARLIGVSQQRWGSWEAFKKSSARGIRSDDLRKLAETFDVTADWIIGLGDRTLLSVQRDRLRAAEALMWSRPIPDHWLEANITPKS